MNIWELQASANIEPQLSEEDSDNIAREAVEGYRIDKRSRSGWEKRMEDANKLAMQVREEKTFPWPKAANIKFPLVTIGALQFQARAYPTLVKAPNPVKYRVTGVDEDGQKAARASRIGAHMSYQLLDEDEAWEEEMDALMVTLPIVGCAFKKSYFDSVEGHSVSRAVLPRHLVVNYSTKRIDQCERKTEEIMMSAREITLRQKRGIYSEKELGQAQTRQNLQQDENQGVTQPVEDKKRDRPLLEQHTWLDLDEDGVEEPYVLLIDESSKKLLRIVQRFDEVETEQTVELKKLTDQYKILETQIQALIQQGQAQANQVAQEDPDKALEMAQKVEQQVMNMRGQQDQLKDRMTVLADSNESEPKVLSVSAREYYTKYTFIPDPDGGFYDLGLGSLLGPVNDSVNTLINQLLDAGTMQVGSRGFIGRGARIQGGKIEFRSPFEWKRVNVAGSTLRDSMVPLPVNEPSNVLFSLLGLLIQYGERISTVNETMAGDNPGQNTPAFNFQAMMQAGMQVFNSIFKRCYRSFRGELRKRYQLNRTYLNTIDYFETMGGRFRIMQKDYSADERHLIPAADPNAFSNMEKSQKAFFLAERAEVAPGYNKPRVERKLLESMDIEDVDDVYPVDEKGNPAIPPPVNPEVELKKAEEARRARESEQRYRIQAFEADTKASVAEADIVLKSAQAQSLSADAALKRFEAINERQEKRREAFLKSVELEIRDKEADAKQKAADRPAGSGD